MNYRAIESEDDFEFIIKRCVEEAKNGHFSRNYALPIPSIQAGLRSQIECAVTDSPYPFEPGNPRHGTGAQITLVVQEDQRIGFILLLEHMPGSWNDKVELHLLSIVPEHRGRGIGTKIVRDILNLIPARKIYARCYVVSKVMIGILEKNGFQTEATSCQGTQTLNLQR